MANIAVFGGTFNPLHKGHYQVIKALCDSDMFSKVLVVPDRIPPHKPLSTDATDKDRIEMCKIVCDDFTKAKLCLIEFDREGKSYTVDTIKELKKMYPEDSFFVVCGADMLKTLDTWHNFNELKTIVSFVVFNRDNDLSFLDDVKRISDLGANIIVFNDEIISISSTELRNKRRIYKQ